MLQELKKQINELTYIAMSNEEKIMKLHKISGFTIDQLIDLFLQGYTLEPPKELRNIADLIMKK